MFILLPNSSNAYTEFNIHYSRRCCRWIGMQLACWASWRFANWHHFSYHFSAWLSVFIGRLQFEQIHRISHARTHTLCGAQWLRDSFALSIYMLFYSIGFFSIFFFSKNNLISLLSHLISVFRALGAFDCMNILASTIFQYESNFRNLNKAPWP